MLIGGLLFTAVAIGAAVGIVFPHAAGPSGDLTDPLILALVTLLLAGVRIGDLASLRQAPRTVAAALAINFVVVPGVALAISSVVMVDAEALRIGVLLYCLFPCTDWFLGFTRLAGGDTLTGSALIPLNMAIQLALYPLYLHLLTDTPLDQLGVGDWAVLVQWFALPAGIALTARIAVRLLSFPAVRDRSVDRLIRVADAAVVPVLALLIGCIFCANANTVVAHPVPFWRVLACVFCFFVAIYAIGELVTRRLHLAHAQRALVVMTTSARNAPLVLALTVVALPDEPIVHAAIVLGMLVEFPHLTVLQLLLRNDASRSALARMRDSAPEPVS